MIMDALLLFDGSVSAGGVLSGTSVNSGISFTTSANTDSANTIDVSQVAASASGKGRDIGVGDAPELQIAVMVMTSFAGSGANLQVLLQTAPDNGAGAPGSWSIIQESPVIGVAALVAGYKINAFKIPPGVQKFLKLTYVVTGANMTAGAIAAGIVLDNSHLGPNLGYPSGYSNQYV